MAHPERSQRNHRDNGGEHQVAQRGRKKKTRCFRLDVIKNSEKRERQSRKYQPLKNPRLRHGLNFFFHPLALPGEPPPSDLRASGPLRGWSEEEFLRAMRSGVTPDGRRLDPEYMPWPRFAGMTDGELSAIWEFLGEQQGG